MTVRELIEKLQKHDANAKVYVYSDEDDGGDDANGVVAGKEAEGIYFKRPPPWTGKNESNFVVIGLVDKTTDIEGY